MIVGKSYACRNIKENSLREGDYYPTPKSLVWNAKELFHSAISLDEIITEPCCGTGMITRSLKNIGYSKIIENDFYSQREDISHEDILHSDLSWCSKNIVTNFPFSCWDDCVKACLSINGLENMITIGRLNYLSTQNRLENNLWKNLKEIWIFSRYVDYRTKERTDGHFHVGAMATGWFWFTKDECDAPKIRFVDIQEYATLGNLEIKKPINRN